MKMISNVQYGEFSENKLDVYLPEGEGYSAIVYFHGGGFVEGDKAETCYKEIAETFVKNGYAFLSVNYRMYSHGAKFPQFLEDGAQAVAWAKARIQQLGGSGELYVSGQSAGGWLSMMLCLNESYLRAVGVNPQEIKGWMIDSAQTTAHFNVMKHEMDCDPRLQRINEFAPLYYLNANTKFSRMLLLFYDNDMPCRLEQNLLFIKAVKYVYPEADVSYKQLPGGHCHGSTKKDEDGEYAYAKEALRWLK